MCQINLAKENYVISFETFGFILVAPHIAFYDCPSLIQPGYNTAWPHMLFSEILMEASRPFNSSILHVQKTRTT